MIKKILYVFVAVIVSLILVYGCNVPDSQNVFLSSVPVDNFQNLTLKDFPAIEYMSQKAVLWKDKSFVLSFLSQEVPYGPDVLEYDLKGNLLAYTNKEVLTCSPNDMAVSGDDLFVSCMNVGIYRIDLVKNKVVYFYDEKNGLKNNQNLQLAVDGNTLWVGTFKGLGKIDIKTNEIKFYGQELRGVDCVDMPTTQVYARNGEVWVTLTAHAACAGGASRYDSKNDQWVFYGVKDFNKRDLERVDFEQFLISDNGVYAVYQDSGPDFETLSKFNVEKNVWEVVYQDGYEDSYNGLSKYLPLRETYSLVDIKIGAEDWKTTLSVFYVAKWVEVPLVLKEYVDLVHIDDVYYLLSNVGIDVFTKIDKFPKTVAASDDIFTVYKSKLFSTDDKKYVWFFSIDYSEMGGGNNAYGIGVYDIQNKTFFDARLVASEFSKVFGETFVGTGVSFENLQFVYSSGEIKIPVDGGEFVIDLNNKKFFARKL